MHLWYVIGKFLILNRCKLFFTHGLLDLSPRIPLSRLFHSLQLSALSKYTLIFHFLPQNLLTRHKFLASLSILAKSVPLSSTKYLHTGRQVWMEFQMVHGAQT